MDLPKKKMLVETDSVLLHVVFKNLFSNAIKYTNKDGVVGVAMKETKNGVEKKGTQVVVTIPHTTKQKHK